MSKFQCDECNSIYQDLTRRNPAMPHQGKDLLQMVRARMAAIDWPQLRSDLTESDDWRRLVEHHKTTGHSIFPKLYPPSQPSSSN